MRRSRPWLVALFSIVFVASLTVPQATSAVADSTSVGFVPGQSLVVPGLTSATVITYLNPDHSLTSVVSSVPVRYYDHNRGWIDIDLNLYPASPGILRSKNSRSVTISATAPNSPVIIDTMAGPITLSHVDAPGTVVPSVSGASATFAGALAGNRDLVITTLTTGFEETVRLPSTSSPTNYTDRVVLPADVAARQTSRGVEFRDASGTVVGTLENGIAHDASQPPAETAVSVALTSQVANVVMLDVSISPTWLMAPGRVAPITVDPVWTSTTGSGTSSDQRGFDTYVNSDNCAGQYSTQTELRAGSDNRGRDVCTTSTGATYRVARTLMSFPVPVLPGAVVSSATLNMYTFSQLSVAGTDYQAYGLSKAPDATTSWSSQGLSTGTSAVTFVSGTGWFQWDVTSLANTWMQDGAANNGLGVNAADEVGGTSLRSFRSGEAGASTAPNVTITYTSTALSVVQAIDPVLQLSGQTISSLTAAPAQFITKLYTEGLGRAPTSAELTTLSAPYLALLHNCNAVNLANMAKDIYLGPEFSALPYDNSEKLLALLRGLWNGDPLQAAFDTFLAQLNAIPPRPFAQVMDDALADPQFTATAFAACSTTPNYYTNGYAPVSLGAPATSGATTEAQLRTALASAPSGSTVYIARKALITLHDTLSVPMGVTLMTNPGLGLTRNAYAQLGRLVRGSPWSGVPATGDQSPTVNLAPEAKLLDVWVDGQHRHPATAAADTTLWPHGYDVNATMEGGTAGDNTIAARPTVIADSRFDAASGVSIIRGEDLQGADTLPSGRPCDQGLVVTDNLLTSYTTDHVGHSSHWQDGIDTFCDNATITNNEIVDASDTPIGIFRSSSGKPQHSTVSGNLILNPGNSAFAGIILEPFSVKAYYPYVLPHSIDFTGVVSDNVLATGPYTAFDIGISAGSQAFQFEGPSVLGADHANGNSSAADHKSKRPSYLGPGPSITGNNNGHGTVRFEIGVAVAGMWNAEVADNFFGTTSIAAPADGNTCPTVPYVVDPGSGSGNLQPGYWPISMTDCIKV